MRRRIERLARHAAVATAALWACPAAAQETLPADHPKHVTARGVYDDLVRAIGDGRTPPAFRMVEGEGSGREAVAWYRADERAVTLEEKAYDVVAALGPDSLDALAVLLGHELAHAYRDHDWQGHFGRAYRSTDVADELRREAGTEEALVRAETEADYFGGLYGYMAGYETLGLAPRVLAAVYDAYGLGERLAGYPSLADRQEIARTSEARLARLVPVFDAGNLLLLAGAYEEAAHAFDHIAATFPSREILNNAGVARTLAAMEASDPRQMPFVYPVELDPQTRLRRRARGEVDPRRVERLLGEAADRFEQALRRDTAYAPAQLNLAIVHELRGDPELASALAERAARRAEAAGEGLLAARAAVVRGIAQARMGSGAAARESFEAALARGEPAAGLNLAILEGARPDTLFAVGAASGEGAGPRETIAGSGVPRFGGGGAGQTAVEVPAGAGEVMYVRVEEGEGWRQLVVDADARVLSFLETAEGYEGATARGIEVGDGVEVVLEAYGEPAWLRHARGGVFRVYVQPAIIFEFDGGGGVWGWVLYDVRSRE